MNSIQKSEKQTKSDEFSSKTCNLYESCVVKLLKQDEIIEKEINAPLDIPLDPIEIQNDEAINIALTKNFVKVPTSTENPKKTAKKTHKYTENFVRANLSRSKSSKKQGKTICPKKKFRYFTPSTKAQEQEQLLYSNGYKNKIRTNTNDIETILKQEFKFESWREGQLESISSILSGNNVISVLPTGSGKSLIYQMCSRVLGGLCIVISPLLSLISDQLLRLPDCLAASAIYSDISYSSYYQILLQARTGLFDILFITPEKFVSEQIHTLPNISLICIDEAHCISKYSNSSRLSYLVIPKLIKNARIVALTAAVDRVTLEDMKNVLNASIVVSYGKALRPNLCVTVSREEDILTAAGKIIRSERFRTGSVIVYCHMQYIADSVAQWIRSKGETCMSYHSGMPGYKRNKIQEDFVAGRIRIIVATVAFGMGIDKANIAGVLQLHLPYSLEHFIQESGRAGRNGSLANIHIIINDKSLYYQRSLIYSSHITKKHIIHLIKLLNPRTLKRSRDGTSPQGPVLYLIIKEICEEMGLEKERILCLLYYLECKSIILSVCVNTITVNVSFHKTTPEILSEKYAIVSHILNIGKRLAGSRRLSVPELSSRISISVPETIKVLKRLAASGELATEFCDEAFIVTAGALPEDLELLKLAKDAEEYFSNIEEVFRKKIETCYMVLDTIAKDRYNDCVDGNAPLSESIEDYLHNGFFDELPEDEIGDIGLDVNCVSADLDGVLDPKDITCVLQGINTLRTPVSKWRNFHVWGRYTKYQFLQVYKAVIQVLNDDLDKKNKYLDESDEEIIESN